MKCNINSKPSLVVCFIENVDLLRGELNNLSSATQ